MEDQLFGASDEGATGSTFSEARNSLAASGHVSEAVAAVWLNCKTVPKKQTPGEELTLTHRESLDSSFNADLNAPADEVPAHPPVITRVQVLPFGELTWENFERLCYRLAGRGEHVEYVTRYGRSGQAQQGIDLFVRMADRKYQVWQVKRYRSITSTDVKAIVNAFRSGTWKGKTERLILAVQASLADTKVQDEIEAQATALKAEGISFIPHGGEELSEILRGQPEVVDDFFGRGWVEAFLGKESVKALGSRLDGAELARVRTQLRSFYTAHFHLLDIGVALPLDGDDAAQDMLPSLLDRFIIPDVVVRDTVTEVQHKPQSTDPRSVSNASAGFAGASGEAPPTETQRRDYVRRTSLASWLVDGMHLAVIGEAGGGKSTLLRCIALDLLTDQGIFPQIARRWGGLLPIHVSFSRWCRLSVARERPVGLKEVVAETLQPVLTADLLSLLNRAIDEQRVLLLLDGLDEWSEEQAARTTLQNVLAFVTTHSLPTIVTARPLGLRRIGGIPQGWRIAELAPLSLDQQRRLAEVWFSRVVVRSAAPEQGPEVRRLIDASLERFFAELARDRTLSSLAVNPLLLVGLIALSIRQIALPRNRVQAIQSLVAILVETHPERRATAAGDTKPRFAHIPRIEDRRAALGRLAFEVRSASGGGTYDIKKARRVIRDYLFQSATVDDYPAERAQNAANEILAVNAETVGLLAERAPGEIGFAHAVFEEYLAAEHIHSWEFSEITRFARERSGDPLWRNVISNLISLLARPTEVEAVISAIEAARTSEVSLESAISRDVLLADIAFNSSRKQRATAQRLADRAFNIIERGDWMLARREVLKTALANVGDATSPTPVDDRLASWTPRRAKYLYDLFEALGGWKPGPDVREVLLRGIHDEERINQQSAAKALGQSYASDEDVQHRLSQTLRSTLDLSVAAAALEALTLGWPETPGLSDLHDSAAASREPTLKLVGTFGRLARGRSDRSDRDRLVDLLSETAEIDFWDRPAARMMLSQYWPDDPMLIDMALKSVHRIGPHSEFERESAVYYLIRCSPNNPRVADWIREELKEEYPFPLAHDGIWGHLVPFASKYPDIRESIIGYIRSKVGRHNLYRIQKLVIELRGDDLRDELIRIARAEKSWGEYWAVRPLLEGWGRSDPIVASFMDEIASWDDKRLETLAKILPQIVTDFADCRARLLRLARSSDRPRLDLIAHGLASLGCTADDTEVVDTLLAGVSKGARGSIRRDVLLTHFSANPRIRQYALQSLSGRSPPLWALARAYENDTEIRAQILAYANPLPVKLRGDIVEAAAGEANSHSGFKRMLRDYDIEVDSDLKIGASIYYHRYVVQTSIGHNAVHLQELADALHATGLDTDERRAAAFAGMLLLGRVNDIVPMKEYGDTPLKIQTGKSYGEENDSLMALICERWEEVRQAFGDDLPSRFGSLGIDEGHLWDCLAPHISASPAARLDFLAFCRETDTTLGLNSFITLARERPSSDLLLDHCWRVFGRDVTGRHRRHSPWAVRRIRLEIAYILRDQFHGRADVKQHLREVFKRGQGIGAVALAMIEPNDPLLDQLPYEPWEIGQEFSDWATALHLASTRSGAEEFVELVLAMINRNVHGIWNFQEISNRTVIERLQRDTEAVRRFKDKLASNPTESEIATVPRYLMAAGALDDELYERCRLLLQDEARHALPRAGYDAVDDLTRAVSWSLLEVLVPSLSP